MENVMKIEDVEIQRIIYKEQPVLTYEDIDKVHGRIEGTAKRNFSEHREKFIIEKDYFDLPYEEWSILVVRNAYHQNSQGGHRGNRLFFTMYGYLKLAKLFTDDRAWKVQDMLIDSYFNLKAIEKSTMSRYTGNIEDKVIELPGRPLFILDCDLAGIYGVETRHLNATRKRNPERFTSEDYFQITNDELKHLPDIWKGGHLPWAYTKKGAYMFAFIFRTGEAFELLIKIVEGFSTYSEIMRQTRPDWMFNNLRRELLDRSPLWRRILRYKDMGLNHREIALLVHKEVSTVRKHVRRMESCGLLLPPKDLPKLQGYAKHFRLN